MLQYKCSSGEAFPIGGATTKPATKYLFLPNPTFFCVVEIPNVPCFGLDPLVFCGPDATRRPVNHNQRESSSQV
jgi:hypothetical protein